MAEAHQKLGELAAALEQQGADRRRLDLLRRAQRFKRSWVEMAEALVEVRKAEAWREWGYESFHAYADQELLIKRPTADKLTASYRVLERHAPEVLEQDGEQEVPGYDQLGYLAKALGVSPRPEDDADGDEGEANGPQLDEAVAHELQQAVFEENAPVSILRRRFDDVVWPKPPGAEELAALEKTRSAIRRLSALLSDVEGLPRENVIRAEDALEALQDDLERQIADLREHLRHAEAS